MSTANQLRQTIGGPSLPPSYEFGPFVLDTIQHALLKERKSVALTPKTYDTLLVLVQNSGRMLSKEELMKTLWPDSFVEESNLTQQVSMIRKALGESPSDPRYIATVPGRGYRFIAEVRIWAESKPALELIDSRELFSPAGIEKGAGRHAEMAKGEEKQRQDIPILQEAPEAESRKAIWPRISRFVVLGLLPLVAIAAAIWFYRWRSPRPLTLVRPRSLAILPLENLRPDAADDFLGFSLADAIITKLDYVSSLTIRPSAAIAKYRNQMIDIQKVAAELNVDTLLTGSFIRDGDDLRITYQLIEGKTDKILGRGTIEVKYDKLLRVHDDVAQQIIQQLELNLSQSEAERIKADAPVNPLAYEYYLRGVDLHGQHKFPLAIKMLEKSTEIDPRYASAWAYLGASYTSDATFEFGGREQYRRAKAAYERALALDPALLDAQMFLANLLVDTGKVEQAVPLLRDALNTNPNHAAVHWELGYAYRFAGMLKESVAECERARQIDPLVKSNGSVLNAYLYLGEYDKFLASLPEVNDSGFVLFYRGFGEFHQKDWIHAAQDFDRAFDLDPSLYTQIGKALSEFIAHRDSEGLAILRQLETKIAERGVGDPEATYKIAQAYSVLGDKASSLRLLRTSVEDGFFSYPYLARDPLLDPIRNLPGFPDILKVSQSRYQAFKNRFF